MTAAAIYNLAVQASTPTCSYTRLYSEQEMRRCQAATGTAGNHCSQPHSWQFAEQLDELRQTTAAIQYITDQQLQTHCNGCRMCGIRFLTGKARPVMRGPADSIVWLQPLVYTTLLSQHLQCFEQLLPIFFFCRIHTKVEKSRQKKNQRLSLLIMTTSNVHHIIIDHQKLPIIFTERCYASAVLAMGLCVCPSVCLSQVGVLLKRLNGGSHKQHRTIPQKL